MPPTSDLSALVRIGFQPQRWSMVLRVDGLRPVRIVEQHRSGYLIHDGEQVRVAKALPKLRHRSTDASLRPAVGDWALAGVCHGDEWFIQELLPRFSALLRGAAGEGHARQAIATNIDHALIVTGLDRDFNLRRIERYLALVSGSGARPQLVLTKADCIAQAQEQCESVLAIAGAVPVHVVNAKSADSCAALAASLTPGSTAVLIGSSGAGKSTLTNTLLGGAVQATASVRDSDGRGRHTTVSRALKPLPGGACLIDTPGLREIKLTGDEDLVEAGFEDIEALAADCRFRDCQHQREPGCAVRAALESQQLDPARLSNWHKLGGEISRAGDTALARRERKQHDASTTRMPHEVGKRKR